MRLKINDNEFLVKIMLTKKDITEGMMNKKFKSDNHGMLFIMDDGDHNFWMKNCIIPLDIIFIKDNTITSIHHNCQPCKTNDCQNYKGSGNYVLELNGNTCKQYGIKKGDTITF